MILGRARDALAFVFGGSSKTLGRWAGRRPAPPGDRDLHRIALAARRSVVRGEGDARVRNNPALAACRTGTSICARRR